MTRAERISYFRSPVSPQDEKLPTVVPTQLVLVKGYTIVAEAKGKSKEEMMANFMFMEAEEAEDEVTARYSTEKID